MALGGTGETTAAGARAALDVDQAGTFAIAKDVHDGDSGLQAGINYVTSSGEANEGVFPGLNVTLPEAPTTGTTVIIYNGNRTSDTAFKYKIFYEDSQTDYIIANSIVTCIATSQTEWMITSQTVTRVAVTVTNPA